MRVEEKVLDIFKVMVFGNYSRMKDVNTRLSSNGLVLDFFPTKDQENILLEFYKPLDVTTLFTREERENGDPFHLISKQILHYVEVYGLSAPGLFNLEVSSGQLVPLNFVSGVTSNQLKNMVLDLLHRNAPVKNASDLKDIIDHYSIEFDINDVMNNELRVLLFDANTHTFSNGDDVVRWICTAATTTMNDSVKSALLIKSPEMIEAVKNHLTVNEEFLERHALPLAQVFNRHKKLILAMKNKSNRSIINRISKMSKSHHVPLRESVNKTFVSKALSGTIGLDVLDKISIRDKFKYLNLLEYKMLQRNVDAFTIRNGKMHLEAGRKVWNISDVERVSETVLNSLKNDLSNLKQKRILLDPSVHYGLPISRKQTIGNLPYGTKVVANSERISSGIYWENGWGASDLDLSTLDVDGKRTGWGQYSGYNKDNNIAFSGDLTNASNGAMEFMTSGKFDYGLFVNIFTGDVGCGIEIIVGTDENNKKHWISDPIIREKTTLNSRSSILGIVKKNEFVVWSGRIGKNRVSNEGNLPYLSRGMCNFWTVNSLFEALGVGFETVRDNDVEYDFDLTYKQFSLDKLESLLI